MAQGRLRRLVTRRKLKWVGTVLCVIVLGVGVASVWYGVEWWVNRPKRDVYIGISQGCLGFGVYDFHTARNYPHPRNEFRFDPLGNPSINLRPVWPTRLGPPSATEAHAHLPLWMPLLLIAAPTAWLWRTDRRAKPWQCATCRYDLRGLDGGVCPECGEAVMD